MHAHGNAEHGRKRDQLRADVAVAERAVVGAPVGHDAVHVGERALAREPRHEPGGRPGRVGAHFEDVVDLFGQLDAHALGDLKHRAQAVDEVQARHGHGHAAARAKVRRIPAAAEVPKVRIAVLGGVERLGRLLGRQFPPGLDGGLAALLGLAGRVQRDRAGVDQVDEPVCRCALGLPAADALDRRRAPVRAHIREALRPVGEELAHQHGQAVQVVVLRRHDERLANAVPVKGGAQKAFEEVGVWKVVGPLALALEAREDGVVAAGLLLKAQLLEPFVPDHQIARDQVHLDVRQKGLALLFRAVADRRIVLVPAGQGDVFVHPLDRPLKLLEIVDPFLPAADKFGQVHAFRAQAERLFQQRRVHHGTRDAHGRAAHGQVALAAHRRHRQARARKFEQLFLAILGDGKVADVQHVVAVDAKGGQALLVVRRQHGRQVYRAGPLGAVEAVDGLLRQRVHVHGLGAVAPAGRHRDGHPHVFAAELVRADGRLGHAADAGVRDHALDRQTAAMVHMRAQKRGDRPGKAHRRLLQRLAHAPPAAVDAGTDANFGQLAEQAMLRLALCKGVGTCFHKPFLLFSIAKQRSYLFLLY